MYITIDREDAPEWADKYDISEEKIELYIDVRAESTTRHPYGSTTAVETHPPEIMGATYKGRNVVLPEFLEEQIMEEL